MFVWVLLLALAHALPRYHYVDTPMRVPRNEDLVMHLRSHAPDLRITHIWHCSRLVGSCRGVQLFPHGKAVRLDGCNVRVARSVFARKRRARFVVEANSDVEHLIQTFDVLFVHPKTTTIVPTTKTASTTASTTTTTSTLAPTTTTHLSDSTSAPALTRVVQETSKPMLPEETTIEASETTEMDETTTTPAETTIEADAMEITTAVDETAMETAIEASETIAVDETTMPVETTIETDETTTTHVNEMDTTLHPVESSKDDVPEERRPLMPTDEPVSPLGGMGVMLGVGVVVLAALAFLAQRYRNRSAPTALRVNDFEMMPPTHDVEEEEDAQMQLLMTLGDGANPVFIQNL